MGGGQAPQCGRPYTEGPTPTCPVAVAPTYTGGPTTGARYAQLISYVRGPTTARPDPPVRGGRRWRRRGPWSVSSPAQADFFLLSCLPSVNGGCTPTVPSAVAEGPTFRHAGSQVADAQGPAIMRTGPRHHRWRLPQPSPCGGVGPSAYGRGRRRTTADMVSRSHTPWSRRVSPGCDAGRAVGTLSAWDPRRMEADVGGRRRTSNVAAVRRLPSGSSRVVLSVTAA